MRRDGKFDLTCAKAKKISTTRAEEEQSEYIEKSEECNRSLKSDWKEKSDEKLKLRIFEHSLIGGDFDGSRVHYRVQDNSPKECMKTR